METQNSKNQDQSQPNDAADKAAREKADKDSQAKKDQEAKEAADREAADKAAREKEEADLKAKEAEDAKMKEESAKAKAPFTLKHGNEKYTFPASEKKNFIVRQSRVEKMSSGAEVEDPGTITVQIYRPEVYQELIYENEKTGNANAFTQAGLKYIVLHDPTK